MVSAKNVLKDWRILVMIAAVVVAFLAIEPNITGVTGAQVIYLPVNSYLGNLSARGIIGLGQGSIVTALNGIPISNVQQFYSALNKTAVTNTSLTIHYENEIFPYIYEQSNATVFISPGVILNSSNFQAENVPFTHLNYGLDVIGGTQIAVEPNESNYNASVVADLNGIITRRLDVYGISGVSVSTVSALSGKPFILVSMPNLGESQALSLIENQGNFYATIGNKTVFNSSVKNETILDVCTSSGCPFGVYSPPSASSSFGFQFGIQLSSQSTVNFVNAVKHLAPSTSNPGYYNESIVLFVNGKQESSLLIQQGIQNNFNGAITISGSGSSEQDALFSMKTLETIFQTGSLPVPVKIISISSVSPTSGTQFLSQIYLLLFVAFIIVSLVIFVRYRNYKIASLILLTSITEIFVVIGVAALIHWTLDIPSIAGIIASIGISVDDQIIITDEMKRGASKEEYAVTKKRISRAFFIIFVSFFSFSAIMFPLLFSTASLFAGFALTTILASLIGLLITRPAYARIIGGMSEI